MKTKINQIKLAKAIEKFFFPTNTMILATLIAIVYQSASPFFLNNLLVFFFALIMYAFFRKYFSKKIKSETRRFSTPILVVIALTLLILFLFPISKEFNAAFWALVVLVLIFHFVRDKWRISAHAATYTAASTALSLLNRYFVVSFILLPVIVWSRLKLKRHTISQIVAGIVIGAIISLFFYFLFFGF